MDGDILIRGRHIKSVIISHGADMSWAGHFNVTAALNRTAIRSSKLGTCQFLRACGKDERFA